MSTVPLIIDEGTPSNEDFATVTQTSPPSIPYHLVATYDAESIALSGEDSAELSLSFSSSHIEASGLGLAVEVGDEFGFDPALLSDVVLVLHYTVS